MHSHTTNPAAALPFFVLTGARAQVQCKSLLLFDKFKVEHRWWQQVAICVWQTVSCGTADMARLSARAFLQHIPSDLVTYARPPPRSGESFHTVQIENLVVFRSPCDESQRTHSNTIEVRWLILRLFGNSFIDVGHGALQNLRRIS